MLEAKKVVSKGVLAVIYATLVFFGSGSTIFSKLMTSSIILETENGLIVTDFNHPVATTFLMFLGESLLLLTHRCLQAHSSDNPENLLKGEIVSPLWLAIPATMDMVASTLGFVGLYQLAASTYQIMKALPVVYGPLLSIVLFRRTYDTVQWCAILSVLAGISIVALQAKGQTSQGNPILGLLCMFIGQLIQSCQFIFEEWLLQGKAGEPFYVMGWEGCWGMLFTTVLMFVVDASPCPLKTEDCINGHIDDLGFFFKQVQARPMLVLLFLCFIICAMGFNAASILAIKHASGVHRVIAVQLRSISIWIFFLLVPGFGHETFSFVKFVGFFLVATGVMYFNKFITCGKEKMQFDRIEAVDDQELVTTLQRAQTEKSN